MEHTNRRWAVVAIVIATLTAKEGFALDCGGRVATAAARFERVAAHAIDLCVRRSTPSGPTCPDARLTERLVTLHHNIDAAVHRRCPDTDVESTLASIESRLLCAHAGLCNAAPTTMTLRVVASAPPTSSPTARSAGAGTEPPHLHVDAGFTGLAHDLHIMEGAGFAATLSECDGTTDTSCTLHAATAGTSFGAPSPISAGGVSTCVTVDFDSDLAGTMDLASGDLEAAARMHVQVFTGALLERPCPVCITPNGDPQLGASGTCLGGAGDGMPCTVGGLADPDFGVNRATSGDCLPNSNAQVADYLLDIGATTGGVTFAADVPCRIGGSFWSCWCPGEQRANACDDGVCTPTQTGGICDAGPYEQFCATEHFRGCASDDDCGAGDHCTDARFRSCFPDPIEVAGAPDPARDDVAHPVLVGAFCMPASHSGAVNAAAGFPGPTTFVWPTEIVLGH